MRYWMMGLLAETPLHPGAAMGEEVVDLPVQREAATGYPVIFGSSLKGALRDWARQRFGGEASARESEGATASHADRWFGTPEAPGSVACSDARLLALPLRALHRPFVWATCPHLIERWARDVRRMGGPGPAAVQPPAPGTVRLLQAPGKGGDPIFLEEWSFECTPDPEGIAALAAAWQPLVAHAETRGRLADQLVVLNDTDFAWFARYGLPVAAHNQLDPDTKQSQNLWYEETLPPDTVLYATLADRGEEREPEWVQALAAYPYLQVGGNASVGQGWCVVTLWEGGDRGARP